MDWFLYAIGLRDERVNLLNDIPELINNHQCKCNEKTKG